MDTTPNGGTTKIFADIQMKNSDDLNFNYRLIMLLDKENESDSEKRIEKAFRGIKNENDELLYNQYVLGGVEVLYENIIENLQTISLICMTFWMTLTAVIMRI